MGWFIWCGILPACILAAWLVLRRPVRQLTEEMHVEHARDLFRRQREWLEARFISALASFDPAEGHRWEEAQWHDEILWARDRQTRRLLAMVCVHFPSPGFELMSEADPSSRRATALFEFRKGHWVAEGKRLDEVRPDEAVLRSPRYEPVVLHPRRIY